MIRIFVLLLFVGGNLTAQDTLLVESIQLEKSRLGITFTPTAWLHPRLPATQFGVEVALNNHFSIVQDFGFIQKSIPRRKNQRGLKSQTELRIYPFELDRDKGSFYFGIQYRYWQFKYDGDDDFCRFGCLYQQRIDYKVNQSASGVNLTWGWAALLSGKHIFVDWGGAVGIMSRKNRVSAIPDDAEIIERREIFSSQSNTESFKVREGVFLIWIKVGYVF